MTGLSSEAGGTAGGGGLDKDLATLRSLLSYIAADSLDVPVVHPDGRTALDVQVVEMGEVSAWFAECRVIVARVEAELSRLREQRDAGEAQADAEIVGKLVAAEARCAAMEECDCIPAEFSSKACSKCGRRGVVTETTVRSLMIEIRDEKARCARLQQALERIEALDYQDSDLAQGIAREALAGPDTPADTGAAS